MFVVSAKLLLSRARSIDSEFSTTGRYYKILALRFSKISKDPKTKSFFKIVFCMKISNKK
jgi:hypothetical protein